MMVVTRPHHIYIYLDLHTNNPKTNKTQRNVTLLWKLHTKWKTKEAIIYWEARKSTVKAPTDSQKVVGMPLDLYFSMHNLWWSCHLHWSLKAHIIFPVGCLGDSDKRQKQLKQTKTKQKSVHVHVEPSYL